jgi:hypothetical protein
MRGRCPLRWSDCVGYDRRETGGNQRCHGGAAYMEEADMWESHNFCYEPHHDAPLSPRYFILPILFPILSIL